MIAFLINSFSSDHSNLNKLCKEYDVLPSKMPRYIDMNSVLKDMKDHRYEFYACLGQLSKWTRFFLKGLTWTEGSNTIQSIALVCMAAILHISGLEYVDPELCRGHFMYYNNSGRWHSQQCLTESSMRKYTLEQLGWRFTSKDMLHHVISKGMALTGSSIAHQLIPIICLNRLKRSFAAYPLNPICASKTVSQLKKVVQDTHNSDSKGEVRDDREFVMAMHMLAGANIYDVIYDKGTNTMLFLQNC